MNKTKPTASQIEVLMSDWLHNLREQDDKNYTHKGKKGITVRDAAKGTTLTDYLAGDVRDLDPLDLLKRARATAEQMVSSVALRPMHVTFDGTGSYTDTRETVNLATDFFDDKKMSNHAKMDILLGLACHEAAHILHTDMDLKKEHILSGTPAGLQELAMDVSNILEDERIELLLGESNPGTASLLGATKNHYYNNAVSKSEVLKNGPKERIPQMINALICAVRYPSSLDRDFVTDNYDDMNRMKNILTPFPMTQKGILEATDAIVSLLKQEMKEEMKQNQEKQGGKDKDKGKEKGKDGGQGPKGEPTDAETEKALEKALQTAEAKEMLDSVRKMSPGGEDGNPQPMSGSLSEPDTKRFVEEDDAERSGGGPGDPRMFVFKPKGDAAQYARIMNAVRKNIPAMSKALACKTQQTDYELRGLPSGKLNTNKLVSFRAGNPNIFNKKGSVTCSSASVCMLIDESGSMHGAKQQKAREAAVLINETIKRIANVNFYCYGYTSDRFNVYSENGRTSRFALSDTEARGGTPTGRAMAKAAGRLRKSCKDPCLMLVLTDGSPDNSEMVIAEDRRLRSDSFLPVGVGIMCTAVKNTFKDYVVLNDIDRLAKDLGALTKGRLDKMLVRTDSLAG